MGSHYHFIETNPHLRFDRAAAYGCRLDVPAGTAVRFEPGDVKVVALVEIAGNRVVRGGNALCDGPVDKAALPAVLAKAAAEQFGNEPGAAPLPAPAPATIPRQTYAAMYGPTTGDVVRLGDTALHVRVERDLTVYGDECKFGGGKVLREGMGQQVGAAPLLLLLLLPLLLPLLLLLLLLLLLDYSTTPCMTQYSPPIRWAWARRDRSTRSSPTRSSSTTRVFTRPTSGSKTAKFPPSAKQATRTSWRG